MNLNEVIPQEYIVEKFYQYAGYPKYKKLTNVYEGGCPICREGKSWNKKRRLYYIVKEDHILGSHFSQHRHHIMDTKTTFLISLNESVEKIEDISQNTIKYSRVPYGRLLPWQDGWINQVGCTHVFWSLDSKDYNLEPSEKVINRVQDNIQSDDIVLFHDGESAHPQIVQIVEECLKSLNLEL